MPIPSSMRAEAHRMGQDPSFNYEYYRQRQKEALRQKFLEQQAPPTPPGAVPQTNSPATIKQLLAGPTAFDESRVFAELQRQAEEAIMMQQMQRLREQGMFPPMMRKPRNTMDYRLEDRPDWMTPQQYPDWMGVPYR